MTSRFRRYLGFGAPPYIPSNAVIWIDPSRPDLSKAYKSLAGNDFRFLTKRQSSIVATQSILQTVTEYDSGGIIFDQQKGFYVQRGGTNLIPYSSDFDQWQKGSSGGALQGQITKNFSIAPSGSITASRVQLDLNGSSTSLDRSFVDVAVGGTLEGGGVYWCVSFWAKTTAVNVASLEVEIYIKGYFEKILITNQWQFFQVKVEMNPILDSFVGFYLVGDTSANDTADFMVWMDENDELAGVNCLEDAQIAPFFIYTDGAPAAIAPDTCGSYLTNAAVDSNHGLSAVATDTISTVGTKYENNSNVLIDAAFLDKTTGESILVVSAGNTSITLEFATTLDDTTHDLGLSTARTQTELIDFRTNAGDGSDWISCPRNDYDLYLTGVLDEVDETGVKDVSFFFGQDSGSDAISIQVENLTELWVRHLNGGIETSFMTTIPAIQNGDEFKLIFRKRSAVDSEIYYNGFSGSGSIPEDSGDYGALAYMLTADLGCVNSKIIGRLTRFGYIDASKPSIINLEDFFVQSGDVNSVAWYKGLAGSLTPPIFIDGSEFLVFYNINDDVEGTGAAKYVVASFQQAGDVLEDIEIVIDGNVYLLPYDNVQGLHYTQNDSFYDYMATLEGQDLSFEVRKV